MIRDVERLIAHQRPSRNGPAGLQLLQARRQFMLLTAQDAGGLSHRSRSGFRSLYQITPGYVLHSAVMSRARDAGAATKRGRPRLDVPGASVSTWLRPHEHDRLIRLAQRRDVSISALVRQILILRLP